MPYLIFLSRKSNTVQTNVIIITSWFRSHNRVGPSSQERFPESDRSDKDRYQRNDRSDRYGRDSVRDQDRGSDKGDDYRKDRSGDRDPASDSKRDVERPKAREYDGPPGMQPDGDIEVYHLLINRKCIYKYMSLFIF